MTEMKNYVHLIINTFFRFSNFARVIINLFVSIETLVNVPN